MIDSQPSPISGDTSGPVRDEDALHPSQISRRPAGVAVVTCFSCVVYRSGLGSGLLQSGGP